MLGAAASGGLIGIIVEGLLPETLRQTQWQISPSLAVGTIIAVMVLQYLLSKTTHKPELPESIKRYLENPETRPIAWIVASALAALPVGIVLILVVPGDKSQGVAYLAAGVVAGAGALVTFTLNYRQRQHQHQLDILEKRFIDIQDRFAAQDPRMRANAAIRLAEMAEQPEPGNPADKHLRHYPFFARAAAQLSAALHMEEDPRVRDEMKKALKRMTAFAQDSPDQNLLRLLIDELADANRSAARAFYYALGAYLALYEDYKRDDALQRAASVARLVSTPFAGENEPKEVLEILARHLVTRDALQTTELMYSGCKSQREKQDALQDLSKATGQLRDTHDALKSAIEVWRITELESPFDLRDCVLVDVDLRQVCLQKADLRQVKMYRAILAEAHLEGSNLLGAQLQKTNLGGVYLEGAYLAFANLQGAYLRKARLQRADLSLAQLQKSDLESAQMQEANLSEAVLREANLTRAQLQNAILLGTILTETNLSLADLRGAITDETTIIAYDPELTCGCIYDKTGAFAHWPDPPTPEQYEQWKQMPMEEFLKQFEATRQGRMISLSNLSQEE